MNRIFILFFLLLGFTKVDAQIHEIGLFLGGSNYIGDVGPTTYIAPDEFAYGILYKWNKSPRHSWRMSYNQSKITSSDLNSNSPGRTQRGYNFENASQIYIDRQIDEFPIINKSNNGCTEINMSQFYKSNESWKQ